MEIVLFDDAAWRKRTYPLSLTRPVSNLRVGILTINEKWERWCKLSTSFLTVDYLQEKFPLRTSKGEILCVKGDILPSESLVDSLMALKQGDILMKHDEWIAFKTDSQFVHGFQGVMTRDFKPTVFKYELSRLRYPEDIFLKNGEEIEKDFQLITEGRISKSLSSTNRILGDQIFVEEGATVECSILNTLKGPIYLGENSEIWEGCMIRGAFSLGKGSQLKMGTKVYSNVSIGPYSRMGGELNTSVVWGNSAKGHDGYLGSSVIGEWCNWGAGTSNSNMKNNYNKIRLFDYETHSYRETDLHFCGLIMADHSRCSINTTFNTGTIVGVSANIFGVGSLPSYIPDFSWGGAHDFVEYDIEKMKSSSEIAFQRRNQKFDEVEKKICHSVFDLTKNNRTF